MVDNLSWKQQQILISFRKWWEGFSFAYAVWLGRRVPEYTYGETPRGSLLFYEWYIERDILRVYVLPNDVSHQREWQSTFYSAEFGHLRDYSECWPFGGMHTHRDFDASELIACVELVNGEIEKVLPGIVQRATFNICDFHIPPPDSYRIGIVYGSLVTRRENKYVCEHCEGNLGSGLQKRAKNIDHNKRYPSAKTRVAVLRRDGFRCVYCGRAESDGVTLEIDHIIPVAKGGITEMGNLQVLCSSCNRSKGTKIESR